MFRKVLFALMGLALVLLLDSFWVSAEAAAPDADIYNWGYASPGSSQPVCQKIAFHPHRDAARTPSGQHRVQIAATVVEDRYCQH